LLSGHPYQPSWQSDLHHSMNELDKDRINNHSNERFANETGITRTLNPKSTIDLPLVRRWLEIRDDVVERDVTERPARQQDYEQHLRTAIQLLSGVRFAVALDTRVDIEKLGLQHWELRRDEASVEMGKPYRAKLVHVGGDEPAVAVDELFEPEKLKEWAIDCAEFVQIAHVYARRHTLGAKEYNTSVKGSGEPLTIRTQFSTGVEGVVYQRDHAGAPMIGGRPGATPTVASRSVDELLDDAPIGSRVVWRNLPGYGTSWYHENGIKLGQDEFAAHPFGIVSRDDVEMELAKKFYEGTGEPPRSYIEENIFIRTIEFLDAP
jgi:hypothetical protein